MDDLGPVFLWILGGLLKGYIGTPILYYSELYFTTCNKIGRQLPFKPIFRKSIL